jgi:hypothetical protein
VSGSLLDPAEKHSHVSALASSIKMEFVHYQETKVSGSRSQQRPLRWTDEKIFQHDIVGQQDMRRVGEDAGTVLFPFPGGVTSKRMVNLENYWIYDFKASSWY